MRSSNEPVEGSGTELGEPVVSQPAVSIETSFVSIVTAPFRAKALPHPILAVVLRVMLVSARMLPANAVLVPKVAELPTCQKTLSPSPPLVKATDEALAVVSVLPIWKTKTAFGLPCAFRVSAPVNCADDVKQ
jgi:hypothetical protein